MLRMHAVQTITPWLKMQAPPNANLAPAQMYMLFLLNGNAYSSAAWVQLG